MEINLDKAEVPIEVVDEDRAINDFINYVEAYAQNANESVRELFIEAVHELEDSLEGLRLERDFDRLADDDYIDCDDADLVDAEDDDDDDDDDDCDCDNDCRISHGGLIAFLALLGVVGSGLHVEQASFAFWLAFLILLFG